jgi:hypothetical protein
MAIRMIVPAVRGQGFGLGRNRRQKVSSEKQAKTKDLQYSAIDTTVVAILRLLRLTSRTRMLDVLVWCSGGSARVCPTTVLGNSAASNAKRQVDLRSLELLRQRSISYRFHHRTPLGHGQSLRPLV